MVLRPSGDLESVALDRVGEHDGRPVGRLARAAERGEDVAEVVAAEVADERADSPVSSRRRARASWSAPSSGASSAPRTSSAEAPKSAWYAWFGISSIRRRRRLPPSRAYASRSLRPYLSSITSQPLVRNCASSSAARIPGITRSSDWRLRSTIQSALPSPRVSGSATASQRLPSSSSASPSREMKRPPVEAPKCVATYRSASAPKQRRRAPEADRAGGVVDRVRILRARRVALEAAEVAQPRQVGAVEAPEQVLERLEHRRGVGLDADAVARVHVGEPERRHQGHHRGRRRLVAADLQRVAARPLAVRVVDDAHGEPEHPALDRRERCELTGRRLRDGRRHAAIGRSRALRGC